MEECNGFNKVGVTCMGFNFHKNSSTCRFFEDRIAPHYRYDPSLSIDLYLLLPITPLIYSEETTTNTFYYTPDFSSITTDTDTTQQHHTSALIHSEETTTDTFYHKTDFSSIIVIIVAALLGSIASAVVLSYIVGRILAMINKNIFQEEHRQTCPLENEIEIPSYDDDEVLYSTNIIYSLPPLSYEGTIY
ncbi:Hypothetical predicted protein [Mytilus galloprovincialis]|uniref:Apple domain-containing protein n=1 Tax=Mytilus galloprovincialis TaxID=29158 RepID=A0A8B6FB97_MYTGA|nr:Hypothetical predicted protein [Mytilus galloprovincialis]